MQRLRHPIRSIREPFGKAGLTVAILALVFAMVGGAYAAGGLNSKQKKEVKSIAKSFAGKNGAAGANGTNGTPGEKGAAGEKGASGTNGTNGKDGNSVSVNSYSGEECEEAEGEEGAEFTNATGTAYACNGKEGSPWTVGGVLPTGETLKGMWGAGAGNSQFVVMPISFNIPLSGPLAAANVHFASNATGTGDLASGSPTVANFALANEGEFVAKGDLISGTGIPAGTTVADVPTLTSLTLSAAATATATGVTLTATPPASCDNGSGPAPTVANPEADSGNLCAFVNAAEGVEVAGFLSPSIHDAAGAAGASPFGAAVTAFASSALAFIEGSWAVTAG